METESDRDQIEKTEGEGNSITETENEKNSEMQQDKKYNILGIEVNNYSNKRPKKIVPGFIDSDVYDLELHV